MGLSWVPNPSPSQMPGPPSLSPVNGGPGAGQGMSGLLPFPGGTEAEPEALWLETKIGLDEGGDGARAGL